MAEFNSYLGVKFQFESAEARADIVKLINDLDYFEKKLKNNFDTESIKRWTGAMDTAKQGLYEYGVQVDTVTQQSFQNFRAIGQMDRVTREFASGGLNQGLNGLTMFGNTLTRLAVQEGGFKNAISSLAGAFTGPAGIVLAISAAVGLFEAYEKQIKKSEEENQKFSKSLDDAKAKGLEQGLKLQELISISEDQTLSDKKRTEALNAVKKAVSEVNAEYGAQIKTSEDAKKAVDLLTQAYIQQAVVGARMAKVAADTIALESAQTTVAKAKPSDIGKVLAAQATQQLGGTAGLGAGLLIKSLGLQDLSDAINESKRLKDELDKQTAALQSDIKNLSQNPFGVGLTTGTEGAGKAKKEKTEDYGKDLLKDLKYEHLFEERLIQQVKDLKLDSPIIPDTIEALAQKEQKRLAAIRPLVDLTKKQMDENLGKMLSENAAQMSEQFKVQDIDAKERAKNLKLEEDQYKSFARTISKDVTSALKGAYDAMQKGQNPLDSLATAFQNIAEQIAFAVIEASIFEAILSQFPELKGVFAAVGAVSGGGGGPHMFADGGIVSKPTLGVFGEAGPEAIMPLSKLGNVVSNSFSAGAVSGGGSASGGTFVLRGQDLLVSLNRTQKSSALKGQNISLA